MNREEIAQEPDRFFLCVVGGLRSIAELMEVIRGWSEIPAQWYHTAWGFKRKDVLHALFEHSPGDRQIMTYLDHGNLPERELLRSPRLVQTAWPFLAIGMRTYLTGYLQANDRAVPGQKQTGPILTLAQAQELIKTIIPTKIKGGWASNQVTGTGSDNLGLVEVLVDLLGAKKIGRYYNQMLQAAEPGQVRHLFARNRLPVSAISAAWLHNVEQKDAWVLLAQKPVWWDQIQSRAKRQATREQGLGLRSALSTATTPDLMGYLVARI